MPEITTVTAAKVTAAGAVAATIAMISMAEARRRVVEIPRAEEKKHKPPHRSPSPPPSKGGGGGGERRRSRTPERGIRHPDDEDYDNQYFCPKCFMDRIREQSIPKGINTKLPGDNRPYDGSGQPEIWIDDFFNTVRAVGGSAIVACLLLQNYLTGPARS